jgi:hypothetical protein
MHPHPLEYHKAPPNRQVWAECRSIRWGQATHHHEVNVSLFGNFGNEDIRVFQAPLNVRNGEVSFHGEACSVDTPGTPRKNGPKSIVSGMIYAAHLRAGLRLVTPEIARLRNWRDVFRQTC